MFVNIYYKGIQYFKSPITVRLVTPFEIRFNRVNIEKNIMLIHLDCTCMLLPYNSVWLEYFNKTHISCWLMWSSANSCDGMVIHLWNNHISRAQMNNMQLLFQIKISTILKGIPYVRLAETVCKTLL